MAGICNLNNVVYQATIFTKEKVKDKNVYIRILSVRWKLGYNNHIHSFSNKHLKNQTASSKHFWRLKNIVLTPKIQWKILKISTTHSYFDGCQEEKIQIMLYIDPVNLLNQRCDFIARWRHRNEFRPFQKIMK